MAELSLTADPLNELADLGVSQQEVQCVEVSAKIFLTRHHAMDTKVTIMADVDGRVHFVSRETFLEPAILMARPWDQMVASVPAPRDASAHHAGLGAFVQHEPVVA